MNNQKPLNEEVIMSHVEYLRGLESQGELILSGPFTDYPGGMVIVIAEDLNEATNIANSDPFIASGYKSYEIRTLMLANEENNYLLGELDPRSTS
ncbi:YciI family protein [Paenibacillus solani]|nr:YciI family protein [Paenibacillus solani]